MELSDNPQNKSFLGRDFFTWLLAKSIYDKGQIKLEGLETFGLLFDKNITFISELEKKDKTVIKGEFPGIEWGSAIALLEGKKVDKASIVISYQGQDYKFGISGESIDIIGFKTSFPKQMFQEDAATSRLAAYELFRSFFDKIFECFLKIRINPEKWKNEIKKIESFIKDQMQNIKL